MSEFNGSITGRGQLAGTIAGALDIAGNPQAVGRLAGAIHASLALSGSAVDGAGIDFLTQSIDLTHGELSLGNVMSGVQTSFTTSIWFRHPIFGWPSSGVAALLYKKNALLVRLIAQGGLGQMHVQIGAVSGYVPDHTMTGKFWNCLTISYSAGTVLVTANGSPIVLQNVSGAWPTSIPSSTYSLFIGATAVNNSRFGGPIANIAIWEGFAASLSQHLAIWNDFRPRDARDMLIDSGVPQPSYYVIGNGSSLEVIHGTTPSTTGTVIPSALVPTPRRSVGSPTFTRRFLLNNANEQGGGQYPAGLKPYSGFPSMLAIPGTETILIAYSRGTTLDDNHTGFLARSPDGGRTWPIGGRTHPASGASEMAIPHGDLSSSATPKRGFALARILGIGAGGGGRIFCPFVEAQIVGTPSRKIYLMYSDDEGLSWSGPIPMGGAGTNWNSIGKGRIVQRPDGSLIMPYYRQMVGEGTYTSSLMTSIDGGLTWMHLSDIAVGVTSLQYEEPFVIYEGPVLVAHVRLDQGRDILEARSADGGLTWTPLAKIYDGWSGPVFTQKGGLRIALVRHDVADLNAAYGDIVVSHDDATWGMPTRFTDRSSDGFMYADLAILPDESIACVYAQEYPTGGAYLEFGVLDEGFLQAL